MSKKSSVQKQPIVLNTIAKENKQIEVVDFYRDILTFMQHPVTQEFIVKLARNWVLWARDCEDAINPSRFIVDAGIHWNTAMRWCKKFEELQEAYDAVKRIIGLRNEKSIAAVDIKSLSFMMPSYLDEYKDQYEWRTAMKAKSVEAQQPNITVVIPKYGDNDV